MAEEEFSDEEYDQNEGGGMQQLTIVAPVLKQSVDYFAQSQRSTLAE